MLQTRQRRKQSGDPPPETKPEDVQPQLEKSSSLPISESFQYDQSSSDYGESNQKMQETGGMEMYLRTPTTPKLAKEISYD